MRFHGKPSDGPLRDLVRFRGKPSDGPLRDLVRRNIHYTYYCVQYTVYIYISTGIYYIFRRAPLLSP